MQKILSLSLVLLLVVTPFLNVDAKAHPGHPNLLVSAENDAFENHFSGSMVVEVIVRDDNISSTDEHVGEPDVTLNGNKLRMVQGSDGSWYAYFANTKKAKQADQVAFTGELGKSLDFGVFCDKSTNQSILGASFSESDGVAIPDGNGINGTTQGTSSFNECTGGPLDTPIINQNNVVRNFPNPNSNSGVPIGQIGINPNSWPFIQLFSFNDKVTILYNKGGGAQKVVLTYSDIPNISLTLDRTGYPKGAEVFVTINDMQLNQDPTSIDSWTFNINSPRSTFYQAFTETGTLSGADSLGLVDLNPYLKTLGFEKNGNLGMNLGSIIELKTNQYQPQNPIDNGATTSYDKIITLVESEPNSGIFQSFDFNDKSTIGISNDAPRGQAASIEYNSKSASIVSGTFTASLSLDVKSGQFNPGQKAIITLVDNDQNLNQEADEDLDVFRSTAIIPTLTIGTPVTLEKASDVKFYSAPNFVGTIDIPSTVSDINSDRLVLDTRSINMDFETMTIDLGIITNTLQDLFINVNPDLGGTNWINYDLRSLEQLGITDFSDTSIKLHFGELDTSVVTIVESGDISSGQGLVQITDDVIDDINTISGSLPVFLEINFDESNNTPTSNVGTSFDEIETLPIVFDLFSFGEKNGQQTNNAIYRAELEETSSNSGIFTGTMEYSVTNQLNQFDPNLIKSLRTIDDEIKFLINDKLINEEGINLAYSDIADVGVTTEISSKTDIQTHSGTVTLGSQTYKFGQSVVLTLTDQDLNTKHDVIDVYHVIDDPSSTADDTVGDSDGNILLEIEIKGFRYHRCTVNGVETGGLGSTGFALIETGSDTGVFKGSFKMPSKICSEDGTKLISPAGGSIEVNYFDFRDASGQPQEVGLTFPKPSSGKEPTQTLIDESVQGINVKDTKMKDTFDKPILKPAVGQKINFVTEVSNGFDKKSQSYSYIIQVTDENGKIVDLHWIDGVIEPKKEKSVKIQWEPLLSGTYTIEIFVWNGINSAIPLSTKTEYHINVN